MIVLEGAPSLRTPDGWRELEAGEVVSFPRGERGGHQLVNRTGATGPLPRASTHGDPDIVFYPDSDKVGASERPPARRRRQAVLPARRRGRLLGRRDAARGPVRPRRSERVEA